jgi:hypothetical protein
MTSRSMTLVLTFAFLVSLTVTTTTHAFHPVQARDLSMGMTSAANAVGIRVVGLNPAFLAFRSQPTTTVTIPMLSFGFRFGNNAYSNKDIAEYFRGGMRWDETDLEYLAGRVDQDKLAFTTDMWTQIIGVTFPTKFLDMAVTYDMGMSLETNFSDDFTNLILLGNPLDSLGQEKSFDNTDLSGYFLSRIGLTFAKNFDYAEEIDWMDELTAGVTFHYYIGHSFFDIEDFSGSFLTDYDGTTSSGYMEVVGAGKLSGDENDDFYSDDFVSGGGVGLDLGVGAKVLDGRGTVGLSIVNLINQMTWSNGRRAVYSYDLDGLPLSGMSDSLWFEEHFNSVDSLSNETQNLKTELPRLIRLNGAYELTKQITLTTGFTAQFNDVIGADAFVRGGLGIEHRTMDWFSLRGGMSLGGRSGVAFGAGFGLHHGIWQTDIGFGWEHGVFDSAKGMRFGIMTVLHFDHAEEMARIIGDDD